MQAKVIRGDREEGHYAQERPKRYQSWIIEILHNGKQYNGEGESTTENPLPKEDLSLHTSSY